MTRLKAFIAISILMGMRKQSNYKTYWMKDSLFHCHMIFNIFTRAQFMKLQRCLHITNRATYDNMDRGDPRYDNLGKHDG